MIITKGGSPLRGLVSQSSGNKYKSYLTFEEAKKHNNVYLIMEGDDGGQIYLTCPVKLIKCSEKDLENLLKEIDSVEWNDMSMARIVFESAQPGTAIAGGMGGGQIHDRLWVHEKLSVSSDRIKTMLGLS